MDSYYVAFFLLVIYVIITVGVPRLIGSGRLLVSHPSRTLRIWFASLLVAVVCGVSGLGLLIALAVTEKQSESPDGGWLSLAHWLAGWFGLAVLGVVLFRLGVAAEESRAGLTEATGAFRAMSHRATEHVQGNTTMWMVESDYPVIGVVAQTRRIIVTTSLFKILSEDQLGAVVAHEAAHLRGRHAQLLIVARLAEAVAPSFRASKGLSQATRIGTELIADDHAASLWSPETLASALELAYPDNDTVLLRVARLRRR